MVQEHLCQPLCPMRPCAPCRLREAVVWPFQQPEALARLGAVAPRGVLLYGGCVAAEQASSTRSLHFA